MFGILNNLARAPNALRILAVTLIVLAAVALLWLKSCSDERTAAAKAKLATEQQGAAIESGHDAVETIGNASARETDIHSTVKDGTDAIQNATPGDSNAAADRAACRLHSYRHTARCIALLGPAPK